MVEGKRQQVKQARELNPCASATDIARQVGVSRQRVCEILKSENLPTRRHIQRRSCIICGTPLPSNQMILCSPECRLEYHHPQVECAWCGKLFRISYKWELFRNERNFCSTSCRSKRWSPINLSGRRKRKYETLFPAVLELVGNGESLYAAFTKTGVPPSPSNYQFIREFQHKEEDSNGNTRTGS